MNNTTTRLTKEPFEIVLGLGYIEMCGYQMSFEVRFKFSFK